MSQIEMSVLMRIFPKSVKNGRNQASKSAKDLEVFFCPFLQESNFRNKKSMIQYPRSYQGIGGSQGKSRTQITNRPIWLISQNKSNLFLWQVQSGASCLILQVRKGTVASFQNPDLTNKSWDVHLYCTLMARRDGCLAFQGRNRLEKS